MRVNEVSLRNTEVANVIPVFPEFVIAAVTSSVLGWGMLTWKKAEQAKDVADSAFHKADKVELKMAED